MTAGRLGLALANLLVWSCAATQPPPAAEPVLAPVAPPKPVPLKPIVSVPGDERVLGLPKGVDTALWVSMDSLLASDFLPTGGVVGAYVIRLGDSLPLWSKNPDTRLLPASTQKVYTAVAGLTLLGDQFRWRTTLWRTGSLQGTDLHGDLILEGGGDPTLSSESGALSVFVASLAKQGVSTVHGNLIALDTVAGRNLEAWPGGWTISSAKDGYGAPVVGLNWNQNRIGDRAILEPRAEVLKALRKALLAKGITVKGTDTTVKARGDSLPSRRSFTKVATVASPGLEPVLRNCLRESVNPFAEGVILGLGLGRRGPAREAGLRRIREWLQKQGLNTDKLTVDDGSGLSRYDLTTARQMSGFLARDARNDRVLLGLMAKGGEGTLRKRFALFPDPSQVIAKTGTLDGVSNLTGYLIRPKDTLAFTFLCSGFSGATRPVRELHDRWLARLQGLALTRMDSLATPDSTIPPEPTRTPDTTRRIKPDSTQVPTPLPGSKPLPSAIAARTDSVHSDSLRSSPPRDTVVVRVVGDTATAPTAPARRPVVAPKADSVQPPKPLPTQPSAQPVAGDTLPKQPPTRVAPTDSVKSPAQSDPLDSFPRPFDPNKSID